MGMIAAPGREWQKWSMWARMAFTVIGTMEVVARQLQGKGVIRDDVLLALLALLGAASMGLAFLQQSIPATPEQMVELAQAAADLPVTKGQQDPEITIEVAKPPEPSLAYPPVPKE